MVSEIVVARAESTQSPVREDGALHECKLTGALMHDTTSDGGLALVGLEKDLVKAMRGVVAS